MKSLSAPLETQRTATEGSWIELFDVYLKASITTPFGTSDTLRLCNYSADYSFFSPTQHPEPSGTRGSAATYRAWPIRREVIKGSTSTSDDKLAIVASNVTQQFATMLDSVDWYDCFVVIRKVSPAIATPTANDHVLLFIGQIDSAVITNEQIQFSVSNDLGSWDFQLPRETMHNVCRFQFADDDCTQIPYHVDNWKGGTVGTGSTTSEIISSSLTDDTNAAYATYGTDRVGALADGAVTHSSGSGTASGQVSVDAGTDLLTTKDHPFIDDVVIQFVTTAPAPLAAATNYYVRYNDSNSFRLSATAGGAALDITAGGVFNITSVDGFQGHRCKSVNSNYWALADNTDWGTLTQGHWQIPDAQSGTANAALKPYLQFDFGTARKMATWRFKQLKNLPLERLGRLLVIFSSADATSWTHETYFEIPPVNDAFFDCLIPKASTNRYWRVCLRTKWSESFTRWTFGKVQAMDEVRDYWKHGRITFSSTTTTVSLRGVSRLVINSRSGALKVDQALPAAPVSGDTFVLERGCSKTFNDCCARRNWPYFGGFTTLPEQTIVRL